MQKYLVVEEIRIAVIQRIADLDITDVISVLEVVTEYKELEGFKEISDALMTKIVQKVQKEFKNTEGISSFYAKHLEANPVEMKALMVAVSLSIPDCTNCKEPSNECKDGQEVSSRVKPHVGLRFRAQRGNVGEFISVVSTNEWNNEGDMIYNVSYNWDHAEYGLANSGNFPFQHTVVYLCKD